MRILLIEDEAKVARFVERGLAAESYAVDVARDGDSGLELATTYHYDLLILDLMLPRIDGAEVLRRVRSHNREVPVLILTARDELQLKVKQLEAGADDYLTKPFAIGELIARVRAVMRRTEPSSQQGGQENSVQTDDFRVDLEHRLVTQRGEPVKLTPTEFSLLEAMVSRPDVAVTNMQLLTTVWGPEYRDEIEYLRVSIGRLRRKLEPDPASPRYLQTDPGVGYRFTPGPV